MNRLRDINAGAHGLVATHDRELSSGGRAGSNRYGPEKE